MTLKASLRTATDEDEYLIRNHNANENFGENTANFVDFGRRNLNPKEVARFHQSCPLLEQRTKRISDLNENMCGLEYTSQIVSSLNNGDDQCISPTENLRAEIKDDSEDNISDFSETSPLLGDFDELSSSDEDDHRGLYSPTSNAIEDCNNNKRSVSDDSECSVFSDSSEMTDCQEVSRFVLENNYNNNLPNGPSDDINFPHCLYISDETKDARLSPDGVSRFPNGDDSSIFLPKSALTASNAKFNADVFIPSACSGFEHLTDVNVTQSEQTQDPFALTLNSENEITQDSDINSNATSAIDVNLVSSSFNNFTLSASKHSDILSLVETEECARHVNIQETEPKILNTKQEALPRNMTKEYHYHLQNKICPENGDKTFKHSVDFSGNTSAPSGEDKRALLCGICLQKNVTETDSNDPVAYFDRASLDTNSKCTGCLSTGMLKVSNADCKKNIQNLINDPLRWDSLKFAEVNGSDCVQDKLYGGSDVENSPDWPTTEVAENFPISLDAESPIDNLVPAISLSLEKLVSDASEVHPSSPKYAAVDKERSDLRATKAKITNSKEDTSVQVKCKSVSPARELFGDFDVYNIETTMPTIDWAAMEAHLSRAAKEEDWLVRRHNDREEIRKKLAMDSDSEEYYCGEKVTKKPSLSTRLQSGMNLQICFMNEAASDQESQGSDHDSENGPIDENIQTNKISTTNERPSLILHQNKHASHNLLECSRRTGTPTTVPHDNPKQSIVDKKNNVNNKHRPNFFFPRQRNWNLQLSKTEEQKQNLNDQKKMPEPEENFYTCHARLQAEARMALAQAKEMARMQMEVEKQKIKKSPIADIVGLPFSDSRCHISRQVLADMNVAQLQVIVNDLHTQIENLNEELVKLLLNRDDLHMEQDSMLVDIEDLTRYLGAKDEALQNLQTNEEKQAIPKLMHMLKKNKGK